MHVGDPFARGLLLGGAGDVRPVDLIARAFVTDLPPGLGEFLTTRSGAAADISLDNLCLALSPAQLRTKLVGLAARSQGSGTAAEAAARRLTWLCRGHVAAVLPYEVWRFPRGLTTVQVSNYGRVRSVPAGELLPRCPAPSLGDP